jgi:hypothetical protein
VRGSRPSLVAAEADVDTAKQGPLLQFHPKAPGASADELERAIGSIPYVGPVIPLDLADSPASSDPAERAGD